MISVTLSQLTDILNGELQGAVNTSIRPQTGCRRAAVFSSSASG